MSSTRSRLELARVTLGLVVAALAAAFAALLLGEYPFSGATPWVAGLLVGYLIAEIAVSVGRRQSTGTATAAATFAAAAILWAGWISSGDGKQPYPAMAWVSASLAALAAAVRGASRRKAA